MDGTLLTALALIPALVIAIVFHEVAHGWTALALGDPTAKERKRLTLNPIRHVDPVGTLLVPGALALFGGPVFGWAKPVPVNALRLDNPRFGMMAVAAAGPLTNVVLAALGAVALGLTAPVGAQIIQSGTGLPQLADGAGTVSLLSTGLFFFILINTFLAIFNLLPIPPFDGSHIVEGTMPRRWVHHYERLRPFGMLLFIGLIALTWFAPGLGVLENTIGQPVDWALQHFLTIADYFAGG